MRKSLIMSILSFAVILTMGACNLGESKTTWHACSGYCEIENADIPGTEDDCQNIKGVWNGTQCEISTEESCNELKAKWVGIEILHIGNGKFIRRIDDAYICGSYNDILSEKANENCTNENINLLNQARTDQVCPESDEVSAKYCVKLSDSIRPTFFMCNECSDNLASCNIKDKDGKDKSNCVDLMTDPQNCGECGHICTAPDDSPDTPVYCEFGICKTVQCDAPAFTCPENGNTICVDPSSDKTCGADKDNCEDRGTICQNGYT